MRSLRETHSKIYLLPSSYPPIFKKPRGHHTKVRLKKLRALNQKIGAVPRPCVGYVLDSCGLDIVEKL